MRRLLAPALAAAVLLHAAPASAVEPLDLDLARLGAPSDSVYLELARRQGVTLSSAQARQLASDAKTRFALLSTDMALALTSVVLQPASTTGHAGFDVDLEAGYVEVHPGAIGTPAVTPWPTRSLVPHELFVPSFHVRKALPFSFELGGRLMYLSQSSYFAGQIEAKWAVTEGLTYVPDFALRGAYTQLYGQRDWDLGALELDLLASKRFGVNAVVSFTPYAAARFTFMNASTRVMDFDPKSVTGDPSTWTPQQSIATQAAFPTLRSGFYRTTVGVRMTSFAVSLAGEATWFAGSTISGASDPGPGQYPTVKARSSLGGAFKFGFEF